MKLFIHSVASYSPRCNQVILSFADDVPALPKEVYSFSLFMPKSVQLTAGQVNEVPSWIAKNIWHSQSTAYILKDLFKQGKATVHKRAEKIEIVIAIEEAFKAAEALNVEEPIVESGEFIGKPGDTIITTFKVDKLLKSWENYYEGVWRHNGHGWEHPTAAVCLWQLSDEEGHTFILRCTNDGINSDIAEAKSAGKSFQMEAKIVGHQTFRGLKQTNIKVKKQKIVMIGSDGQPTLEEPKVEAPVEEQEYTDEVPF